ncbi:hypothetical protein DRP53_09650 [candidate division WOR-3 bacterium]|uniref:Sialidase domain-containing protein n=1 Tax=candidate division WOR-3 bacterium TaxID=2052148 RepID=A0A660SFI4_UNCW3|nr:MAG: hypothetical protein DRP53_09650 [candidate division WOR-3 bacterium]
MERYRWLKGSIGESMGRKFCVFVAAFVLNINIASAWFGEDVRVSDTTGGFFGCIEPWIVKGPDNVLSVVWSSDYTSAFDCHIYFSKSTDMGKTWTPGIRVDDATPPDACLYPSLAVDSSGNLYCIWYKLGSPDEIRFSKSTDGGATWTPSVVVDEASAQNCGGGEITVSGDELLVVWADSRTGWRCYFSKSTDGGNTWTSGIKITPDELSTAPRIEVFGDTIYAAYMVYYSPKDIYLSRSTDNGSSWEVMGRINDVSSGEQRYHDIALAPDGDICCAWYDWRSGECEIRFSKSTDGGVSWIPSVVASDTSWSQNPILGEIRMNLVCVDENRIYALWQDSRTGSWDIFFTMSEDGGVTWSEDIMVNDSAYVDSPQMVPSLCLEENGNPCVVWSDYRGPTNSHIYFDKGEIVGVEEVVFHPPFESPLLLEIFPNPFHDRVNIRWRIEDGRWKPEDISLRIYDATGRLVKEFIPPTAYSSVPTVISWDGRDDSGRKVRCGVYFVRLETGDRKFTRKALLLR